MQGGDPLGNPRQVQADAHVLLDDAVDGLGLLLLTDHRAAGHQGEHEHGEGRGYAHLHHEGQVGEAKSLHL